MESAATVEGFRIEAVFKHFSIIEKFGFSLVKVRIGSACSDFAYLREKMKIKKILT